MGSLIVGRPAVGRALVRRVVRCKGRRGAAREDRFRTFIMKFYLVLLVSSLTATLCASLSETDPSAYNALDYASMTGKYDSRYMPFAGSYAYKPYYSAVV